jgi:hypothetical protein
MRRRALLTARSTIVGGFCCAVHPIVLRVLWRISALRDNPVMIS